MNDHIIRYAPVKPDERSARLSAGLFIAGIVSLIGAGYWWPLTLVLTVAGLISGIIGIVRASQSTLAWLATIFNLVLLAAFLIMLIATLH